MKFVELRPCADPEAAARRLVEHTHAVEPIQEGRSDIEELNRPFLFPDKATPAEYSARQKLCIARGRLVRHESRTFVTCAQPGTDLFT